MPKSRVPHLKKKKEDAPEPTLAQKLEVLLGRSRPLRKAARKPRRRGAEEAGDGVRFRRAVTRREAQRIYRLRHSGPPPLSYSEIGRRLRMPVMTVWQAYRRFVANGNNFVDGNLRKGHYPHGKLVGAAKDFLLSRETLQQWSGFSLEHRCHLL